MFKFLSLFSRNKDEQLNDNDYDFNEVPVSENDIKGIVESQIPVSSSITSERKEKPLVATPRIDADRQEASDKADIERVREKLSAITGDLQPKDEDEITTLAPPSPEVNKGHLQPPDLDLIKGYKETREEKPPGITHYKNSDGELWFVNTAHVHSGGIHEDPTLRTIKIVIDKNDPAFLITEGHMTNMTDARRRELLEANRELVQAGGDMPESGYAAYLANQKNQAGLKEIAWVGGEPSGKEFFQPMQDHGYSKEDILAITVLKQIADGNLRDADFGTQYNDIMQKTADRLDPQNELKLSTTLKDFTFERLKEWYARQGLPEGDNFLDVHQRHFVPDPERENIFHKWMADSGIERDRHIARVIYDQLKTHGKGVITYGADHLNSLDPVLTQMFGKPGEYTQPVKEEAVMGAAA